MADLTGQYTTADLPQMGEFSPTDVDTSTIPSVPLSAMTGVPKTLRDIATGEFLSDPVKYYNKALWGK